MKKLHKISLGEVENVSTQWEGKVTSYIPLAERLLIDFKKYKPYWIKTGIGYSERLVYALS